MDAAQWPQTNTRLVQAGKKPALHQKARPLMRSYGIPSWYPEEVYIDRIPAKERAKVLVESSFQALSITGKDNVVS